MSLNTKWCLHLMDGLARGGVRHMAVCPGSRSTPLALAARHHPDLRLRVVLDERDAGFWALGVAKATGVPAAVLTTSGTAVANLLPAVVEASNAAVPLVVLTADRPEELRGRGANQTIEQRGLFGAFVRHEVDLPHPETDALDLLEQEMAACMEAVQGRCPGPVHLNQPLREPLAPDATELEQLAAAASVGHRPIHPEPITVDAEPVHGLGVIVAGPGPVSQEAAQRILQAAQHLGAPVLADPLSGLRYAGASVLSAFDAWVDAVDPQVDWIIQFGATPTSKDLGQWLGRNDAKRIRIDPTGRRWDAHGSPQWIDGEPAEGMEAIANTSASGAPDPRWQAADQAARSELDPTGLEAQAVVAALGATPRLFVGNSLAVRDLDRFGHDGQATVFGNRGASGIDGNLATLAGMADGAGPVLGVVGDLAFQHDVGGLALLRQSNARVVVVHNGGGGIFRHLPVASTPHFEELFLTPQHFDIEAACAAFQVTHRRVQGDGLQEALRSDIQVMEWVVDGETAATRRQQVTAAARRAAKAVWGALRQP